jgi:hypothetical protein
MRYSDKRVYQRLYIAVTQSVYETILAKRASCARAGLL